MISGEDGVCMFITCPLPEFQKIDLHETDSWLRECGQGANVFKSRCQSNLLQPSVRWANYPIRAGSVNQVFVRAIHQGLVGKEPTITVKGYILGAPVK